ncbi:uncharacterized protein A4U43_C02F5480 [Asparagus officinalis]|uniref:Uncharacterized protein n=1 Tax=Asparagus officinalis TaxID=4686 RepID=A0A5P1FG41_ASPOF|nr:uncharacterized protein A4U43_C02F5480 [Asparagus officinalis]
MQDQSFWRTGRCWGGEGGVGTTGGRPALCREGDDGPLVRSRLRNTACDGEECSLRRAVVKSVPEITAPLVWFLLLSVMKLSHELVLPQTKAEGVDGRSRTLSDLPPPLLNLTAGRIHADLLSPLLLIVFQGWTGRRGSSAAPHAVAVAEERIGKATEVAPILLANGSDSGDESVGDPSDAV